MSLNNPKTFSIDWEGKQLSIETGRVAKQAGGSVIVRIGDTMVMVNATASHDINPQPSLPLTVNFQQQNYAAGKFPGGFFKREGRPSEKEVLTSRIIDRPIRPLFPDGYQYETQVIATVISSDGENDSDIPAITGASAALCISDLPFAGPIAGARVGRIDGQYVLNPTQAELAESDLDAIIVVSEESVVMVEGGARFVSESDIVGALDFAFEKCQPVIALQKQMMQEVGKTKRVLPEPEPLDESLTEKIKTQFSDAIRQAASTRTKHERYAALGEIKKQAVEAFGQTEDGEDRTSEVKAVFSKLEKKTVRTMIRDGERVDGRDSSTVREIEIETGWIPRTHGSALFTRGETQAIVTTTLGTSDDEKKEDSLEREIYKKFYLHYNFPPYSVGEARRMGPPGRREIGHGILAERAFLPALPDLETFPYTIRVVSDITESNGSSSMASVCGASLAMMQAGVPLAGHLAGVAMGLIKEGDDFIVLTDILGDEDHIGDMDFKVAGSREGVTSFQMDIKIAGVTGEIMERALYQARDARMHIIEEMNKALPEYAKELSPHAPRLTTMRINPEKIGAVIGPGGKVIRQLCADTGAKIDIEEDGLIKIFSTTGAGANAARHQIELITKDIERGQYYVGTVRKIMPFGAFVEVLPGTDGLVHISEVAEERIQAVEDVLKEGDRFPVVVLDVDPSGKIRLSRKQALDKSIDDVMAM